MNIYNNNLPPIPQSSQGTPQDNFPQEPIHSLETRVIVVAGKNIPKSIQSEKELQIDENHDISFIARMNSESLIQTEGLLEKSEPEPIENEEDDFSFGAEEAGDISDVGNKSESEDTSKK